MTFVFEHVSYLFKTSNLLNLASCNFSIYDDIAGRFIASIDAVLEHHSHEYCKYNIRPHQFFFLCKQAMESAFSLPDTINVLKWNYHNFMKTVEMFSYFFLPRYITYKLSCPNEKKKKKTIKVQLQCTSHGPVKGIRSMKAYLPLRLFEKDSVPLDFLCYVSSTDSTPSYKLPVFNPSELIK